MVTSEKHIEKKLVYLVEKRGGKCVKFPASFFNGFPDRMCLIPMGIIFFVEVKSTGEVPRPLQLAVHKTLRKLGFLVYVIDSVEQINPAIDDAIHNKRLT